MTSMSLDAPTEAQRLACYTAFFSIAASDGTLDGEELVSIFDLMDLEDLSEDSQRRICHFIVEHPRMNDVLAPLREAPLPLRFGLLMCLTDIAMADAIIMDEEHRDLLNAADDLNIDPKKLKILREFISSVRGLRARGKDDGQAFDRLEAYAEKLQEEGIPPEAVFFSGSVLGLRAAGLDGALHAIDPGNRLGSMGIANFLGGGAFQHLRRVLGWSTESTTMAYQPTANSDILIYLKEAHQSLSARLKRVRDTHVQRILGRRVRSLEYVIRYFEERISSR